MQSSLFDQDITENYHQGAETSVLANVSMRYSKEHLRNLIASHVLNKGQEGATSDEVERALGISHQTCSARFTELKANGTLIDTGERRKTRSGRSAAVLAHWAGI